MHIHKDWGSQKPRARPARPGYLAPRRWSQSKAPTVAIGTPSSQMGLVRCQSGAAGFTNASDDASMASRQPSGSGDTMTASGDDHFRRSPRIAHARGARGHERLHHPSIQRSVALPELDDVPFTPTHASQVQDCLP